MSIEIDICHCILTDVEISLHFGIVALPERAAPGSLSRGLGDGRGRLLPRVIGSVRIPGNENRT